MLIYSYATFILGANRTPESLERGIKFFFCRSESEPCFADVAAAISTTIRIDVILLRFQYEFWRRALVFPRPFEWTAMPVPDRVINAMAAKADEIGMVLASTVWFQPGMHVGEAIHAVIDRLHPPPNKTIRKGEAIAAAKARWDLEQGAYADEIPSHEARILQTINDLTDAYILSREGDSLWLTLRNPELEQEDWAKENRRDASRHNLWWTRMF